MATGIIFISHRTEYGAIAHQIRDAIQRTSRGKIEVFISEEIKPGKNWRQDLEDVLKRSETLLLLYGAPNEDWSWCFYEVGYFTALDAMEKNRKILCVARPNIPPPDPLGHIQSVTDSDQLIDAILEIFAKHDVDPDAGELRELMNDIALFSEISAFTSFKKVYFLVDEAVFKDDTTIPGVAEITSTEGVIKDLFSIGRDTITWSELLAPANRPSHEVLFYSKWIEEMTRVILAARKKRYVSAQALLVGRQGRKFRFLLYGAGTRGDGKFYCEFLAIDEVGGPTLGLSCQLLTLLTSIRMAFRFRYELIERFYDDDHDISDSQWKALTDDFLLLMSDLITESESRGNVALEDLIGAFTDVEARRIRRLARVWPIVYESLTTSLQAPDGPADADQLKARKVKFQAAFEALQLINIEFLSRCCARVSNMMQRSDEELGENATRLDAITQELKKMKAAGG